MNIFKVASFAILLLIFGGCLGEKPQPPKGHIKTYAAEDIGILIGLRAEQLTNHKGASEMFDSLWKVTQKKEYLYRSLANDLSAKHYKEIVMKIDSITQESEALDDYELIRIKILALIRLKKLDEAKLLAISLVEKTKTEDDYILVSDIYIKQKKFNTALKYLESAYTREYQEKILNKMSIILYVNLERKKEAIAQLETHRRIHGCSKLICGRLVGFYSDGNNIDGLLSIYLKLYELQHSSGIAKKIVQVYRYKKDYVKLISFLKESKSDDKLLLELYIDTKRYKKAYTLAQTLYEESGDLNFLGQSAIFEYESYKNPLDKKMQKRVIKKLKQVTKEQKIPLYLNYLGYLLIDHSIDIKDGMKYVREALKIKPKSPYYLDSLAWGYYKLGKCFSAYKLIKKVTKLKGGDDPEVKQHLKIIKKCRDKKIKGKKKR